MIVENINLKPIHSGVIELLHAIEDQRWNALQANFQNLGIVARAVIFDPPEISAIAVRQSDYDQSQLIDHLVDGTRSVLDFMRHVGVEISDAYGIAFNIDNPIIQSLGEYNGDQIVLDTILRAIYANAILTAGIELTPELSQTIAHDQMRIIELLLEQAKQIESS